MQEAQLLYEVSAQLMEATTPEEVLNVIGAIGPPGRTSTMLFTVEVDGERHPQWLKLAAASFSGERRSLSERIEVTATPLHKEWLANPEQPLVVKDILTDPRGDEETKKLSAMAGVRAFVGLPLSMRGRWIGLISTSWASPQEFGEADMRLYGAVLRQAAIVMDHRLLLQKTQEALKEARQQRRALASIVENIPIGIFVGDSRTGAPLLVNSAAVEILGRGVDPNASKDDLAKVNYLFYPDSEDAIPPSELPLVIAMSGKRARRDVDIVHPDGTRLTVDAIAAPIRDESGAIISAVVSFQDVTERKRAERERARIQMQDELIRAQATALVERSTPLIPISESIMVMPIIGSIDSDRADQMMQSLLEGISHPGVRFAVLDVTGVRNIDTQAANAIMKAAKAVRLLGIEPVLTGIRAEVAQTLIGLGIDLREIATRSTLQTGIAYANQMVHKGHR